MSKDSKRKELGNGWLLCNSKRREGRSYLFNKNTGETKWCDGSKDVQEILGMTLKTNEGSQQDDKDNTPSTSKKAKQQLNTPPINVAAKVKTPAQDRLKRLQTDLKVKNDREKQLNRRGIKSNKADISTPLPAGTYKRTDRSWEQNVSDKEEQPVTSKETTLLQRTTSTKPSNVTNKERAPKRAASTEIAEIPPTKRSFVSMSAAMVAPTTREPATATSADTPKKLDKNNERKYIVPKRRLPATATKQSPHSPIASGQSKGIANERLNRLRKSLQELQEVSAMDGKSVTTKQLDDKAEMMDMEPMDWEEVDVPNNEACLNGFSRISEIRGAASEQQSNGNSSIGDIIDVVGQNITRLAAEQSAGIKQKWHINCYYFVLDTNIWLDQLAFIKDLMEMKPCDTSGVILYIPYRVLQELDKLKQNTTREGLKTRAARAIRFLNERFEKSPMGIQAQGAIAEREHLIDVTSPDDSIINCCLQVKKNIRNVILLSEDVNLRNKAISNDILCSTKADLLRKKL